MRNRLLPAVGITPGISGQDWASLWLDREGLVAAQGEPTTPAPKAGGRWARILLSSDEAATWLGEIFRLYDIDPLGPGGGTRSFKPTILSWMTKAGAPQRLQRPAGYHVEPGAKNPLQVEVCAIRTERNPVAGSAAGPSIDDALKIVTEDRGPGS